MYCVGTLRIRYIGIITCLVSRIGSRPWRQYAAHSVTKIMEVCTKKQTRLSAHIHCAADQRQP